MNNSSSSDSTTDAVKHCKSKKTASTKEMLKKLSRVSLASPAGWDDFIDKIVEADKFKHRSDLYFVGRLDYHDAPPLFWVVEEKAHFEGLFKEAKSKECTFTIYIYTLKVKQPFHNERKFLEKLFLLKDSVLSVVIYMGNPLKKNDAEDVRDCGEPTVTQAGPSNNLDVAKLSTKMTEADNLISSLKDLMLDIKGCVSQTETKRTVVEKIVLEKTKPDEKIVNHDQARSSVMCSNCQKYVGVVHYTCLDCCDYMLCEDCELSSETIHAISHRFMKIKNAVQAQCGKPGKNLAHNLPIVLKAPYKIETDLVQSAPRDKIYSPGQKILKIWNVKNKTTRTWNSGLYKFKCINPDMKLKNTQASFPVPPLKPGEKGKVNVFFQVCEQLDNFTKFETDWQLHYKDEGFGKIYKFCLNAQPNRMVDDKKLESSKFTQTENSSLDSDNFSMSDSEHSWDDDDIPFPACFNMDVPFKKEGDHSNPRSVQHDGDALRQMAVMGGKQSLIGGDPHQPQAFFDAFLKRWLNP